jgi:5-oxoprolinase (ATP-hydrolysing) subunit A
MNLTINADLGEGGQFDEALMPFIDLANIATGYHAGGPDHIEKAIELCLKHNVKIGWHPSYADRENFGRKAQAIKANDLIDLIVVQYEVFYEISSRMNAQIHHVKPHGALYNQLASNRLMAFSFCQALKKIEVDHQVLMLANSPGLIAVAKKGFSVLGEVFADRAYQDDKTLVPRSQKNAVLEEENELLQRINLLKEKSQIQSISGNLLKINAQTICVHGDGPKALEIVKLLKTLL